MEKKKPTPTKAEAGQVTNTPKVPADYIEPQAGEYCPDCFEDDGQQTFVPPCDECEAFTLPSRASREARILTDLARGVWLTNQAIYEAYGGTHDGRKSLSLLRKDYGLQIDWDLVAEGRSDRRHRIKPRCLPFVQRRLAAEWGLNLMAAARASKARQSKSTPRRPRLQRRGG